MYTVGKHPEASKSYSVFKWAVFLNGVLFEGFRSKSDAEIAAAEYNAEVK